jgi:hypothetical protein
MLLTGYDPRHINSIYINNYLLQELPYYYHNTTYFPDHLTIPPGFKQVFIRHIQNSIFLNTYFTIIKSELPTPTTISYTKIPTVLVSLSGVKDFPEWLKCWYNYIKIMEVKDSMALTIWDIINGTCMKPTEGTTNIRTWGKANLYAQLIIAKNCKAHIRT